MDIIFSINFTPPPEALSAFLASSGFALLRDYFKKYLISTDYFAESQWGFIGSMAAYSILATFVYKHTLDYPLILSMVLLFMALDIVMLATMIFKQYTKTKSGTDAQVTILLAGK